MVLHHSTGATPMHAYAKLRLGHDADVIEARSVRRLRGGLCDVHSFHRNLVTAFVVIVNLTTEVEK